MKLIRFAQSIAGYGDPTRSGDKSFAFAPGQEVLIEKEIATAWTESGIAEFISQVAPEPVVPVTPVAEYAIARRGPGRPPKAIVVVPDVITEEAPEEQKEG